MPPLRISPRASDDLIEIWSFIADDSVANADVFIDRLYETIQVLGARPGSGRHRKELGPGIRSFPFGHYVIFYRDINRVIEIVRVLHGARDIGNIFGSPQSSDEEIG